MVVTLVSDWFTYFYSTAAWVSKKIYSSKENTRHARNPFFFLFNLIFRVNIFAYSSHTVANNIIQAHQDPFLVYFFTKAPAQKFYLDRD